MLPAYTTVKTWEGGGGKDVNVEYVSNIISMIHPTPHDVLPG